MLSLGADDYNSKGPPQDMCNISINMILLFEFDLLFPISKVSKALKRALWHFHTWLGFHLSVFVLILVSHQKMVMKTPKFEKTKVF